MGDFVREVVGVSFGPSRSQVATVYLDVWKRFVQGWCSEDSACAETDACYGLAAISGVECLAEEDFGFSRDYTGFRDTTPTKY